MIETGADAAESVDDGVNFFDCQSYFSQNENELDSDKNK